MKQAILAEARRLVDEGGFEQLSVRAIARALAYSPGALYEYFPDREAILHGLYFDGAGGLGDTLESTLASLPAGTNPIVELAELARSYRRYALDNAELYRLTFGALARPPIAQHVDERRGGFGTLAGAVQRGVEAGVLTPTSPIALGVTCWSAVHGFVSLELSGHLAGGEQPGLMPPSPEEGRRVRDALFEHHLQALFRGLVREDHRAMLDDGTTSKLSQAGTLSD
jgi:AcrR family transcriptional regulator